MINCFQNAVPIIYVFDISIFLIFLIFYNIFELPIVFRTWCPGNPDCDDPKMLCQDLVDDYHSYQVKILQEFILYVSFTKPLPLLVAFSFIHFLPILQWYLDILKSNQTFLLWFYKVWFVSWATIDNCYFRCWRRSSPRDTCK